jgi:heterodisulfide reductase subunit C
MENLKKIGLETDKCYQCGTCSGDCPIAQLDSNFNPRKLVLATGNGQLVDADILWRCATCYKCYRCPRDVKPAEVLSVARKYWVKKGVYPKVVKIFAELIEEYGELPELKLVLAVKGFNSASMIPPQLIWRMLRKGKISLRAKKSNCAEEVRKIFEIAGGADA